MTKWIFFPKHDPPNISNPQNAPKFSKKTLGCYEQRKTTSQRELPHHWHAEFRITIVKISILQALAVADF